MQNIVEIIIVKYNNRDYENETVLQVLNTVKTFYHLTVYENYVPDYRLSSVWNRLIKKSDAKYICLLNSDTIPQGDWLEKLISTLKNKEVGAVGPVTNIAAAPQGGFNSAIDKSPIEVHHLSGFCMAFRRSVWREIGGFDEDFVLYGEDSFFCEQLKRRGYKLIMRPDVFVYHHGHKTAEKKKDIHKIRKESSALYRKKISELWKN